MGLGGAGLRGPRVGSGVDAPPVAGLGAAGVVGPLVFSQIKGIALYVAAGMLLLGFVLAFMYKPPAKQRA